jgi:hypothetical protein
MTLEALLKERREAILCICAKHGARNVRVFGSVASGEADEQSDIDLLVDMEQGRSLLDLCPKAMRGIKGSRCRWWSPPILPARYAIYEALEVNDSAVQVSDASYANMVIPQTSKCRQR